jgi:5-methylcytosine-specific restriction protein A
MPTIFLGRKKQGEVTFNKSALQKFYNTPRWKRLRALKFRENPLCEKCLAKGLVRQTEEVHHIIPTNIQHPDEDLIYDYDNLISLCKECHTEAHNPKGMNPIEKQIAERREVR